MAFELTHNRLHFDVAKFTLETLEDSRFSRLKLYVMHSGENPNKSNFDISVIKNAEDSILNIPILAYINEDDDDFGEHEMEYDEDTDEIIYLEKPIGVIPSTNHNYHYEDIDGKTYVVVHGYVWNQYAQDAVDIINRDKEVKISMEIVIDDSKYNPKTKILDIKKYRYTGITLLGKKYKTGMINAKANLDNFSLKENNEFKEKVQELNQFLMKFSNSENSNLENHETNEGNKSEYSLNDTKNNEEEEKLVTKTKQEIAAQFKLTANQLYAEMSRCLGKITYKAKNWYGEEVDRCCYYLRDYDETYAYIVDCQKDYIDVKVPYSMNGDNVEFNFEEAKRIKYSPTDWEDGDEESEGNMMKEFVSVVEKEASEKFSALKTEYEAKVSEKEDAILDLGQKYTDLESKFTQKDEVISQKDQEISALKTEIETFKAQEDDEKVEELLASYASLITEEEKTELKEKRKEFAVFADYEKEIKSFVCDRVIAKATEANGNATFISMSVHEDVKDENKKELSLWERLKNKQ